MSKVLSIIGPTAVGKTEFTFKIAEVFLSQQLVAGVDIISADSRQVYKGLAVISGADVPADFKEKEHPDLKQLSTFHQRGSIRLFGIGLLSPTQDWSVSQFQVYAQKIIELSTAENRLALLVGGTGLYQQHLFTSDPQLHVPPNLQVRERAELMSVEELQGWVNDIDSKRLKKMNESDRQNPRRLVRAIEISLFNKHKTDTYERLIGPERPYSQLNIGLIDSIEAITERIMLRVTERMARGAVNEVEALLVNFPDQKLPAFSATGVKPLIMLSHGQLDHQESADAWIRQERQYAKRQLTWWKKQPDVTWFSVTDKSWQKTALDQIETWYKS